MTGIETPAHWPIGKVATEQGNYYEFGDERFLSVTSALSAISKEALVPWAALLSARSAFARLPELVASLLTRPCGNTYNRCYQQHGRQERCARCPCLSCRECMLKWVAYRHHEERFRRSDEGTEIHAVFNDWVMRGGGPFPTRHERPELVPYLKSAARMVQDYGITPECFIMGSATVLNRQHMYAGTLDCALDVSKMTGPRGRELAARLFAADNMAFSGEVIADLKSREGDGKRLYPDQAIQLVGYQNGEVIRLADGTELPMPPFRFCVIIQVRPDGADIEPVRTGPAEFQAFLHAIGMFRWQIEEGTKAISPKTFPIPKPVKASRTRPAGPSSNADAGPATATPPRKTATRKATKTAERPLAQRVLGDPSAILSNGKEIPF